jgi:hypothetical protein
MPDLDPALPPATRALAERLRAFLRETVPEAEERLYKGGRGAGYRTRAAGTFCGLFLRDDGASLVFTRGADLPDPHGLLRGDGPGVRYVALRPDRPVPEDILFPLVVAALLVGGDPRP